MDDLKNRSSIELLGLHVDVLKELRRRGVIRSENIPTGDFAEFLFCRTFSWRQASKSEKAFDAEDGKGNRYQIKGRRHTPQNKSRQLSFIRDLNGFDTLAAILFGERYDVERAALISSEVVRERCKFVSYTNGYRFMLTDDVWDDRRVTDVTEKLRAAALQEMGDVA